MIIMISFGAETDEELYQMIYLEMQTFQIQLGQYKYQNCFENVW